MIQYVKAKRNLIVGGVQGTRYIARILRSPNVSMDQMAKEISHATTLSYPDVIACLKAFELHVASKIIDGQAVKFDYLGMFIPKIVSKSFATAAEVESTAIKRISCRFYPSSSFKKEVKTTPLREAEVPATV